LKKTNNFESERQVYVSKGHFKKQPTQNQAAITFRKERDMSVDEIKEKIQHIVDRMNATGMDAVDPLEMFALRKELVTLYNKHSHLSN
jgi:uncharacterized FlaG/YvyC family protein